MLCTNVQMLKTARLEDSIRSFLGNDIGEEYIKLANYSVKDVLGNSKVGECIKYFLHS